MPTLNIQTQNARNTNLRRFGRTVAYTLAGAGVLLALHTGYTAVRDNSRKDKINSSVEMLVEKGQYLAAQERLDEPDARSILDEQELAKSKSDILEIRETAQRKQMRDTLRPQIIRAYASGEQLPAEATTAFTPADLEDLRRESVTHTPEGLLARIRTRVGAQRIDAIAEFRTAYPKHPGVEGIDRIELETHIDTGRGYFRTNAIEFDDILEHVRGFQRFLAERQDPTDINAIGEYLEEGNAYIARMSACTRIEIGDDVVLTAALGDASGRRGGYFRGDSLETYPLGTAGKVVRTDRDDDTVRVRFSERRENWFLENEVRTDGDHQCDGRGQMLVGDKVKTIAMLGAINGESGYFNSQTSAKEHPIGSEGYIRAKSDSGLIGVQFAGANTTAWFAPKELERTQTDFLPIIQQHLLSIEREAGR